MASWLSLAVVAACSANPIPPGVCDPNPCQTANRNLCVLQAETPLCLCNAGFLPRPDGSCEEVQITNCPLHGGDNAEPDDCMPKARILTPTDGARAQTIDPIGDLDFLVFDAQAGHVYDFTVDSSGQVFPRIDLYDRAGAWITAAEQLDVARLSLKLTVTAPYFVRISHSPVDPSPAMGAYTVLLTSPGREDHGDAFNAATPIGSIPTATNVTGRFELSDDVDVFSFPAASGTPYRITFDGGGIVPTVTGYLAAAPTVAQFSASTTTVDFSFTTTDTAYLVVSPNGGVLGWYSFSLTR
jgi:hypothetical protein